MLAPLTRRTSHRKSLRRVGLRAERGLFQRRAKIFARNLSRERPSDRPRASEKFQRFDLAPRHRCALENKNLECSLQAVERVPSEGRGRPALFIPYRFKFTNKLTKEHKLQLAFDAFLLSDAIGREVSLGKIVHGDSHATLKVKTSAFVGEVRKRIKSVTALLAGKSPPELLLNRHCNQCEFQTRCRTQAREKDELSLLSGMSEKDRKRLHGKGIFTVTQLSYTFRPRRRRRESKGKQEKYHPSLRALAIRENKIHAVGILEPKFTGTLVFLDVEALPDRDFYYLIGMLVRTAEGNVQHSFWARRRKRGRADMEQFSRRSFRSHRIQS